MTGWRRAIVPGAVILLGLLAWWGLAIDAARIGESLRALGGLGRESWPPETTGWFLRQVWHGLVETLQIAYLATLFGAVLSLPLALLAARNLAPTGLVVAARGIASAIRVLPSLLWAIIAVLIFGLGPLAGVIAMTLYTVGYLAKLQYEAFEGLHRDSLDAVRAMGASRFQQAWHVALPEAGNALRSQILFMLEYNVRASTVVGIVGAGGIGQILMQYLTFGQYDKVLTILLVMFVTVAIMDALSLVVRRRFLEMEEGRRARWRDLLRTGKDPEPPHQ
jgi:phosphonate transport system permease protein